VASPRCRRLLAAGPTLISIAIRFPLPWLPSGPPLPAGSSVSLLRLLSRGVIVPIPVRSLLLAGSGTLPRDILVGHWFTTATTVIDAFLKFRTTVRTDRHVP